jgi:VCBS repeat-containing protein
MRVSGFAKVALFASIVFAVLAAPVSAQSPPTDDTYQEQPSFETPADAPETVPGQIIVKFDEDATRAEEADARRDEGLSNVEKLPLIDAEVAKVEGQSVAQAAQDLERRPDVEYAEPDRVSYPAGYSDEPRFGELWGLNNTGQTIGGSAGTADVDINALEASALTQGDPNLVVAVVDSGVDFSHPDLAGRQWVNPGESGDGKETNGVDDDNNGYVDDVNGWNFCNDTPTPFTAGDHPHGTHVAGTVAASANGTGIVGVAPNVKVMALKFGCGTSGNASTENAVRALAYARKMGVRIANYSYGYLGGPSQAQKEAIENYGGLFVASAGNDGVNNDQNVNFAGYPSSYDLPNILAVAAVDNRGSLGWFSNYGATKVDISAPGVDVLSSLPGSTYDFWNGTSMAAPHVTGTAALVASKNSELLDDVAAIKKVIMDTGKPLAATSGKTVTGDMVDAYAAVQNPTDTAPPTVVGHTPAQGARRVPSSASVEAVFSERLDPDTINENTFTLAPQGDASSPVSATYAFDAATKTATLTPDSPLVADPTSYVATVKGGPTGVKDRSGNALAADATWTFEVSDDATAPTPVLESPAQDTITNDNKPTFSGRAGTATGDLEGVSVEVYKGVQKVAAVAATRSGDSFSAQPSAALPDGVLTAQAVQEDASGNVGKSTPVTFTVDTRVPVVTVSGSPVITWGDNTYGQSRVPGNILGVKAVAGGFGHSLALRSDGTVVTWGRNDYGQTNVPSGLKDVKAIAAGFFHSLALKEDGTVVAWGDNEDGQATVPAGLQNVKAISAGASHSVALKEDGTVVAWGDNVSHQLDVPAGLSGVTAISAGTEHTLALKENGEVVAWGRNDFQGARDALNVPEAARSDVKAISAGGYFSLALKNDGTMVGWGQNPSGLPTDIQGHVKAISAGSSYVLALKDDGTVVAWGFNREGQTNVPAGLSDVRSVDAGISHALAALPDVRTDDPTPSFEFSADEEVKGFECRIDSDEFAPCDSPYTANTLHDGEHALEVRATDLAGNVGTGSRSFAVDAPPPTVVDESGYATDEDTPLNVAAAQGVLVNDTDPNEDPLESVKVSEAGHGTVNLGADGSFVYTPDPNFNGTDSFTYRATDGAKQSDAATATIAVGPVNDAPSVTVGPDQAVDEDTGPQSVAGWLTGSSTGPADEAGQGLSFAVTSDDQDLFSEQPALSPEGTLTYTPTENKNGLATVTVVPKDDGGTPEVSTDDATGEARSFLIEVRTVNDLPTSSDDAYTVSEDTPLVIEAPGILDNDADVDGDQLAPIKTGNVSHGTLALQPDGFFLYIPDEDFNGEDNFTYKTSDSTGESGEATVTITVTPVDEPAPLNTRPTITDTNPAPGSLVRGPVPTIKATIHDDETNLSKENIKLWVDGKRVEAFSYDRATDRLSYKKANLDNGRHRVLIVAKDGKGLSASRLWGFVIRR